VEAGTGGAGAGLWRFLPRLGGGRTRAAGENRRKLWRKVFPAAEDEIDKLLRENPSLGQAWSDLTVMLMKHLWGLVLAPVVVHWLKTRQQCNTPVHAMWSMTLLQLASFLAIQVGLRLGQSGLDHTTFHRTYTAFAFMAGAFMWLGYGIAGSHIPYQSEDYDDKCSKARTGIQTLVATTAALISSSINVHLRKRVFAMHFNNMMWLLTPYLFNHVMVGRHKLNPVDP
jgi:hypothetical protein